MLNRLLLVCSTGRSPPARLLCGGHSKKFDTPSSQFINSTCPPITKRGINYSDPS